MEKLKHLIPALLILLVAGGIDLAIRYNRQARLEAAYKQLPDRILARMSLEQKIGQLLHVSLQSDNIDPTIRREIQEHHVGGVILFSRNLGTPENIQKLTSDMQNLAKANQGVPLLISIDQEGGRVARLRDNGATEFPAAMTIGQSGDPDFARASALVTGYEMDRLGINLVLAPVLDINNNPLNPVINTRSYGESDAVVERMSLAYQAGALQALSGPVIKHFPGHGDTAVDSHLALPKIERDLTDLESLELKPFRKAIRQGAPIVMVAHLLLPALDKEHPSSLSAKIIQGYLRDRLHFQGLVMTDAIEMKAVADRYSPGEIAVRAFQAGVDVILISGFDARVTDAMIQALKQGFASGELDQSRLDASVRRQLDYKIRTALFTRTESTWLADEEFAPIRRADRILIETRETAYQTVLDAYHSISELNFQIAYQAVRAAQAAYTPPSNPAILIYSDERTAEFAKHNLPARNNSIALMGMHTFGDFVRRVRSTDGLRNWLENHASTDITLLIELDENQLAQWRSIAPLLRRRLDGMRRPDAPRPINVRVVLLYTGN
ncbi:MAG: hypothetical protein KDK27_15490, partial [Leptospiraceae bacterium]|nr:hypothetical protein [Leptospiraceae bacterium]